MKREGGREGGEGKGKSEAPRSRHSQFVLTVLV